MRALVAGDDEGLRSVVERGLKENGYVVDAPPDGERALAFLRTYEYDVAVVDWRMPKISGLDVVQELRRAGGADDYLVKPLDFGAAGHSPSPHRIQTAAPDRNRALDPGDPHAPAPERGQAPAIALHVWDEEADALGSNTIDVHLPRLRSKLVGGQCASKRSGASGTG
jgi:CheY-like chemotaxis protein